MKLIKNKFLSEQNTLLSNWEKYRGNIVMVVEDKVYSTRKADNVSSILKKIEAKYHKQPLITYIPKEGTLTFRQAGFF